MGPNGAEGRSLICLPGEDEEEKEDDPRMRGVSAFAPSYGGRAGVLTAAIKRSN